MATNQYKKYQQPDRIYHETITFDSERALRRSRTGRTGGRRDPALASRREDIPRRQDDCLRLPGRHLDSARHGRTRHAPHFHALLRLKPRMEPRQPADSIRFRPSWKQRHLYNGRHGRAGHTPDHQLRHGDSRGFLPRRQGRAVLSRHTGPRVIRHVPLRTHDAALRGARSRRCPETGARHPGQEPLVRTRRVCDALH